MPAYAPAPSSRTELTSRRHRGLRGKQGSAQQETTRVRRPTCSHAGVVLVALAVASAATADGVPGVAGSDGAGTVPAAGRATLEIAHVAPLTLAERLEHFGRDAGGGARAPLVATPLWPALASSVAPNGAIRAWEAPVERDRWQVGALNPDHDDDYAYRLPYASDESYLVLQGYGSKLSHQGAEYFTVDFKMREGTHVHAAREGIVVLVEASHDGGCWSPECADLANYIVVLHPDGTTGEYFHILKDGALVVPGQHVARGQLIALSGNTGYSTTPHLHFGVYERGPSGATHSIGVRFATRSGVIDTLRPGALYLNAAR